MLKEVLETIPVWDGLNSGCECFLCQLMEKAEEDAISYYLGPAIMVPEIRVVMNKKGFCPHHHRLLADKNKAQALSLVCDTYIEEELKELEQAFKAVEKSNQLTCSKSFSKLSDIIAKREEGCLACDKMRDRQERYISTIALLYERDEDFRTALANSKGFCNYHTCELAKGAKNYIKGKVFSDFLKLLASLMQANLKRVKDDVFYLSQKYKSENKDKPFNGCEDAHKRAVVKLASKTRIIEK